MTMYVYIYVYQCMCKYITEHRSKIKEIDESITDPHLPHEVFGRPTRPIPGHLPGWPDTPVRIGFIGQSGANVLALAAS